MKNEVYNNSCYSYSMRCKWLGRVFCNLAHSYIPFLLDGLGVRKQSLYKCAMETSSTVTRDPQTQNSKEFPCQHCSETFKKLFNLKRHVERFHVSTSEVPDADLNSGYCACQSCPFKCHRVADLRKHLSEDHNMTFDIENLTFNSQPGITRIYK